MMKNPKQIRPEWVPLAYQEKDGDVKKEVVVKESGGNGFVKKGIRKMARQSG